MQMDRGRGYFFIGFLAVLAACSGLEPAPSESEPPSGAGGTGAFLHGEAACGNTAGTSGAGSTSAAGGKSSVPSDFGSGGSSGSSSNGSSGGKTSSPSTGGNGGDEPLGGASTGGGGGGGGGGEPETPLGHALLFTEYVEGSSSYKAIEISALEDSSLEGCRVATYFNGATSANGAALEGCCSKESTVVCSSALAAQGAACSRTAGLTFNGDDAVALECEGVVIDVIGQIGVDPGTAWGTGDVTTADHTLRRRCDVTPDLGLDERLRSERRSGSAFRGTASRISANATVRAADAGAGSEG